jgi:hypothetical protein
MGWLLLVLLVPLAALVASLAVLVFGPIQHVRSLKRQGRYRRWVDALASVNCGDGYIVINRTNLPGLVWWTSDAVHGASTSVLLSDESCLTDFRGSLDLVRSQVPASRLIELTGVVRMRTG